LKQPGIGNKTGKQGHQNAEEGGTDSVIRGKTISENQIQDGEGAD